MTASTGHTQPGVSKVFICVAAFEVAVNSLLFILTDTITVPFKFPTLTVLKCCPGTHLLSTFGSLDEQFLLGLLSGLEH